MVPLFVVGAVLLGGALFSAIFGGPTKKNETVDRIQSRLDHEEDIAERKRKNDQDARELRKERKRVQEMEANIRKRQEEALRIMQEEQLRQQRTRASADRKVQDEERRKRKEEERVAKQKNEEEAAELARQMEEIKIREEKLKEAVEKERQLAERERATRAAEEKFGPLRWPTREEFRHALRASQYDDRYFHFAIVGRAGSGKSSLINAFLNLENKHPSAAPTGTRETTLITGRYKDPGAQAPRKWMVWFDVPGAGTQRIPHYDYFIRQELYVYDFIILAIGDRFEEIDIRILENCARFKIPAFIVRSKADMHILNSMKEYGDYDSINDDLALYVKCRDTFIQETQQTVSEGLAMQGLPDQFVYVVSRYELQREYNKSLEPPRRLAGPVRPGLKSIHESHLVKDLLSAAAQRRCGTSTEKTTLDWVKGKYTAVQEQLSSFGLGFAGSSALHQESQPSRAMPPTVPDIQQQHVHQDTPEIRKMIFPYQATNSEDLYDEMSQHDPELPNMLVGIPRMFTPRAAMLTFYPFAPIPDRIYAFGIWLRVNEYKDKQEGKKGTGRGGRAQTAENKQKNSEGYKGNTASARGSANRGRGGRGGRGKGRGENKQGASHQRPVTPPPDYWGGNDGWDDDGWGGGGY